MKALQLTIAAVCLVLIASHAVAQQNAHKHSQTKQMDKPNESKKLVEDFFTAFGNGNVDGILATFHENATIIAIRDSDTKPGEPYGSYRGKEGVKAFLTTLGNIFDTQAFSVEHIIGEGDVAFANGKFIHKVKATGKLHASDWALMCTISNGKIIQFHFYEDSASLARANQQ